MEEMESEHANQTVDAGGDELPLDGSVHIVKRGVYSKP
jgi:hypothetical protein